MLGISVSAATIRKVIKMLKFAEEHEWQVSVFDKDSQEWVIQWHIRGVSDRDVQQKLLAIQKDEAWWEQARDVSFMVKGLSRKRYQSTRAEALWTWYPRMGWRMSFTYHPIERSPR